MTQPTFAIVVCALAALVLAGGCGKKEEPAPKAAAPATAAPATAAQETEVKKLVEDTKRYAESLKAQPAGDRASAEQLSKLPGLLEQLLRHMEERTQASQQGSDVAKPEAQVAEDLKQMQEANNQERRPPRVRKNRPSTGSARTSPRSPRSRSRGRSSWPSCARPSAKAATLIPASAQVRREPRLQMELKRPNLKLRQPVLQIKSPTVLEIQSPKQKQQTGTSLC